MRLTESAAIMCVLSVTGTMASAVVGNPQGVPSASEAHTLPDLTRQLEADRQPRHFSWPPDCWVGDDREAVTKFLADNDLRVRDLRRELEKAHTRGENPLKSLDVARTACNVM